MADLCDSKEPCIRQEAKFPPREGAAARGDKVAMRPFAKLLCTLAHIASTQSLWVAGRFGQDKFDLGRVKPNIW